mmetsp:Transcript_30406/g.73341  ORF Transcript_30406/g.73341 Transcript_30406/m.73341 type:complete len:205 (-) Transcript_30406:137-751(-)
MPLSRQIGSTHHHHGWPWVPRTLLSLTTGKQPRWRTRECQMLPPHFRVSQGMKIWMIMPSTDDDAVVAAGADVAGSERFHLPSHAMLLFLIPFLKVTLYAPPEILPWPCQICASEYRRIQIYLRFSSDRSSSPPIPSVAVPQRRGGTDIYCFHRQLKCCLLYPPRCCWGHWRALDCHLPWQRCLRHWDLCGTSRTSRFPDPHPL